MLLGIKTMKVKNFLVNLYYDLLAPDSGSVTPSCPSVYFEPPSPPHNGEVWAAFLWKATIVTVAVILLISHPTY